jgi:hypothetical protein
MGREFEKKLELHYYLNNESHSMDAFIRNECEKEILIILKEIITNLNISIEIESEAYTEGGLRQVWKFLGKHQNQISLLVSVAAFIFSRFPPESDIQIENTQLQNTNLKLQNTELRLRIKKLSNELKIKDEISADDTFAMVELLNQENKISWHKSNFYKKMIPYNKVTQISTQPLNKENQPIGELLTIEKSRFHEFVLKSDSLPPVVNENAEIDIISPVLKRGNFPWKGFYMGNIISFEMADQEFTKSVFKKDIEFITGTSIVCILVQYLKIEESGSIKISKNKVVRVFQLNNSNSIKITAAGRKRRSSNKQNEDQLNLDL